MPLEGRGLSYRYPGGGGWVFRQVDFTVEPGTVTGLAGPSGCGKSTLGKLLAGHIRPAQGRVLADGSLLPAKGRNPVQLVLQHPEQAVNPRWKLRAVLEEAGPIDRGLLRELAVEEEWLSRYPNELSGGELQRICVARALGAGTRYLIADEMTAMLDAVTQAQIWHAVLNWAECKRAGVLVTSHEPRLLNRLCSRVWEWEMLTTNTP